MIKSRLAHQRRRLVQFLARLAADDRGYSSELVVVTMALVLLGITVGRIIGDEVIAAAESIVLSVIR